MAVLRRRRWYELAIGAATLLTVFAPGGLVGQTFVQLSELSPEHTVGPRITQTVALNKLNRQLFGALTAKVTLVDALLSPAVAYEFSTDAVWNRILFGQKDEYIYAFTNAGSSTSRLLGPSGIDVSARRTVFIADQMNGRVVLARFDAAAKSLTQVATVEGDPYLGGVVDVAWDGGTTPLVTENFYALDGAGRLSYWQWSGSGAPLRQWVYGSYGTAVGQFNGPSGVCVGHALGIGGGSIFTENLYVVDRWNKRLVWLQRTESGATWLSSIVLPDGGVPADCTVDHFGNVYVADSRNSRLVKYTWNLYYLDRYGIYGIGAANHNTFAHPQAIHAPFGTRRNSGGQTIWYGEGRLVTAEDWGPESGAREHYLGLDAAITGGPDTSGGRATFSYRVTDHAYHTIRLVRDATSQVYLEWWRGLMPPGQHSWFWSGSETDPEGYYHFEVLLTSAYGCSSQPWCARSLWSASFWHAGSPPPPPPPPDCDPNCVSAPAPDDAPATLFLRQRLATAGRPLARIAGAAASAPNASATTPAGSLSELVRQYGVRGLSFGIPRGASPALVAIRVYSVAGRPVRTLVHEVVEPGYYEIAWDGLDDRGQAAAPGVYFAVLTAGGQRVVQRLILRQAP